MDARASIELDRHYFEAVYDDWLRYKSVYRRHQRAIGVTAILLGAAVTCTSDLTILGAALLAIGMYEVLSAPLHRQRWVSARLQGKRSGGTVELAFTEDGIEHRGPFSEGKMSWSGLGECLETPHGLVFRPQEGIQMYVPKSAIVPGEAVATICERLKAVERQPNDPSDPE